MSTSVYLHLIQLDGLMELCTQYMLNERKKEKEKNSKLFFIYIFKVL